MGSISTQVRWSVNGAAVSMVCGPARAGPCKKDGWT